MDFGLRLGIFGNGVPPPSTTTPSTNSAQRGCPCSQSAKASGAARPRTTAVLPTP